MEADQICTKGNILSRVNVGWEAEIGTSKVTGFHPLFASQ